MKYRIVTFKAWKIHGIPYASCGLAALASSGDVDEKNAEVV
jgi:hypothetical protein